MDIIQYSSFDSEYTEETHSDDLCLFVSELHYKMISNWFTGVQM